MATIKRGATLKVTLELTAEEWAAVHPWESIRAIGTDVIMVDAGPLPGARRR